VISRDQDRERLHQVGGNAEESGTFPNRLQHPGSVSPGEVSQPSMDDAQAVGRGGTPEVGPVHQRDGKAAQAGIPGDAGTLNAGPDYEEVERSLGESRDVASHAGKGGV
jgi:hypothetical protein